MTAKGPIKVVLERRGALTLRDSDYVAAGGEGTVFKANSTIVKIFHDKDKMARDGMADKIKLLADRIKNDNIVAPEGLVSDEVGHPIGFYMPFVTGEPMSRVFTSDFRARSGFGDKDAVAVATEMRDVVISAHKAGAVMVDANELNWLVQQIKKGGVSANGGFVPKVIDVDSWAIGRWPATVIMPSIRDWHAKTFDEMTDWFAYGVNAFQIFTGIHPYKGKLDGYRPGDLVQRMKDNASVFHPKARMPHSVRDFSCIPGPLLDWFRATFQDGSRSAPPSPLDASRPAKAAAVLRAVTTATGRLLFEKLFDRASDPVVRVWANGAALLRSGEVVDLADGSTIGFLASSDGEVVRNINGWLLADLGRGAPSLSWSAPAPTDRAIGVVSLPFTLTTSKFFRAGERLFAVTDKEMVEIDLRLLRQPVAVLGARTAVRFNSTSWFDGVAVQDVLGSTFLVLPIEGGGVVQPRVKELDGAKVIAAKAGGRFASFVTLDKSGNYEKLELTFEKNFVGYKAWRGGTDSPDLNIGIPLGGVVGTILNDGELTLFVPTNGSVSKIQDKNVATDMRLAEFREKLVYVRDGAVWRVRMNP